MRLFGLLAWAVAVILGFFVSGAVTKLVLMPLAPPDADVGFATLVGLLRFAVWIIFVWLVARVFRAAT